MKFQKIRNKFISFFEDSYIKKIIVFGLIFRLVLFLLFFSVISYPDTYEYKRLASSILHLNLDGYTGERTFGYPLLVALCLNNNFLVAIAQIFIGILTWILWYKTFKNINFSAKTSFFCTIFIGSFIHGFLYEISILVESVALFFISYIFYLISDNFFKKSDKKLNYLMAFLVGYLILIKPFYIFLPFIIYGFSVLKDFSFKKIFSHKIIILFSGLLVYFGLSFFNKINTGHFVSTTYFGLNLSQNCVYFAENTTSEYKEFGAIYALEREKVIKEDKDVAMSVWYGLDSLKKHVGIEYFPDFSAYLGEYAKATISLNKETYIKQVITVSWVNFWNIDMYWEHLKFPNSSIETFFKTVWKVQYIVLMTFKIAFVLLIPYYIFLFFRNRKITFELITITMIFATSVLQAIAIFGNNARFSYPFEYLMIIVVLMFIRTIYQKSKLKN